MNNLTNPATQRQCTALDIAVHFSDTSGVEVRTLCIGDTSLPLLTIRDEATLVTVFFENTDQVDNLIQTLRDYRSENKIVSELPWNGEA